MIKLIAFDVDGTLAGKRHKVSKENIAAIKRAREAGIKIALATGRSPFGMRKIAEQIFSSKYEDYNVGLNGGMVFKFNKNMEPEVVTEVFFSQEEVFKIFEIAKKNSIKLVTYIKGEKFFISNSRRGFFIWWMKRKLKYKLVSFDPKEHKDIKVFKFVAFGKQKNAKKFRNEMQKLNLETFAFSYVSSSLQNIEVNPNGVNKGHGVKKLAELYNIKRSEIMYFGDGENDISAFQVVDYPIAMSNAREHVKEFAKYETGHYKKNGVGDMINKHLDNIKY